MEGGGCGGSCGGLVQVSQGTGEAEREMLLIRLDVRDTGADAICAADRGDNEADNVPSWLSIPPPPMTAFSGLGAICCLYRAPSSVLVTGWRSAHPPSLPPRGPRPPPNPTCVPPQLLSFHSLCPLSGFRRFAFFSYFFSESISPSWSEAARALQLWLMMSKELHRWGGGGRLLTGNILKIWLKWLFPATQRPNSASRVGEVSSFFAFCE